MQLIVTCYGNVRREIGAEMRRETNLWVASGNHLVCNAVRRKKSRGIQVDAFLGSISNDDE